MKILQAFDFIMTKKTIFISIVIMLLIPLTGCFINTMPTFQSIISNVKYVDVYGQSATIFSDLGGRYSPNMDYALVPRIELNRGDKLAIYIVDDNTLSIVINGQDREVKVKLYRLGFAGVSMSEGWDWRHSLAELERQMRDYE